MALTEKKRRFADALLSGAGKTKAAIEAGYSEKTAPQAASKLLKDADVTAYMERRKAFDETKQQVKSEAEKVNSERHADAQANGFDYRAVAERMILDNEKVYPEISVKLIDILGKLDQASAAGKGKKEQAKDKAKEVAAGKFGTRQPPQLKAVPGGRP